MNPAQLLIIGMVVGTALGIFIGLLSASTRASVEFDVRCPGCKKRLNVRPLFHSVECVDPFIECDRIVGPFRRPSIITHDDWELYMTIMGARLAAAVNKFRGPVMIKWEGGIVASDEQHGRFVISAESITSGARSGT